MEYFSSSISAALISLTIMFSTSWVQWVGQKPTRNSWQKRTFRQSLQRAVKYTSTIYTSESRAPRIHVRPRACRPRPGTLNAKTVLRSEGALRSIHRRREIRSPRATCMSRCLMVCREPPMSGRAELPRALSSKAGIPGPACAPTGFASDTDWRGMDSPFPSRLDFVGYSQTYAVRSERSLRELSCSPKVRERRRGRQASEGKSRESDGRMLICAPESGAANRQFRHGAGRGTSSRAAAVAAAE